MYIHPHTYVHISYILHTYTYIFKIKFCFVCCPYIAQTSLQVLGLVDFPSSVPQLRLTGRCAHAQLINFLLFIWDFCLFCGQTKGSKQSHTHEDVL